MKTGDYENLKSLKRVSAKLCVNSDRNLILQGAKLVIPSALQNRVLAIAREGHQGAVRTKQLLREKVRFAGTDAKAENVKHENNTTAMHGRLNRTCEHKSCLLESNMHRSALKAGFLLFEAGGGWGEDHNTEEEVGLFLLFSASEGKHKMSCFVLKVEDQSVSMGVHSTT